MNDDNYFRYKHYKPPYRKEGMFFCNCCALYKAPILNITLSNAPSAAESVGTENEEPEPEAVDSSESPVQEDSIDEGIMSAVGADEAPFVEQYPHTADLPFTEAIQQPGAVESGTIVEPEKTEEAAAYAPDTADADRCGLLHYRKWWERAEVEISVNTRPVKGIPIFIEKNTLRVINDEHSYFIPLDKVDYIQTTDGLNSCRCVPKKHR